MCLLYVWMLGTGSLFKVGCERGKCFSCISRCWTPVIVSSRGGRGDIQTIMLESGVKH